MRRFGYIMGSLALVWGGSVLALSVFGVVPAWNALWSPVMAVSAYLCFRSARCWP